MTKETKPETSPNIHQRMLAVIAELGKVDKDGVSAEGYHHHKIDTIVGALRPLLVKHGVLMTYSVLPDSCHLESVVLEKFRDGRSYQLIQSAANTVLEITLWNADDPNDRLSALSWGQGLNNSDKAAAISISYALKSWLLAAFQLRGQEDAESHDTRRGAPFSREADLGKPMKFAGSCVACKQPIALGDEILFSKEHGTRHQVCPPAEGYGLTHDEEDALDAWLADPRIKGKSELEGRLLDVRHNPKSADQVSKALEYCREHYTEPREA